MTDAERKKWRWMKPLAIALSYAIQYPIALLIRLIFLPIMVVCVGFWLLGEVLMHVRNFLERWIAYKPLNQIFKWGGFYDLANKARKEQA